MEISGGTFRSICRGFPPPNVRVRTRHRERIILPSCSSLFRVLQSLSTKSLVCVCGGGGADIFWERDRTWEGELQPNGDLPGYDTQAECLLMVPYVSLEPKMAQGKWVLQTVSDH